MKENFDTQSYRDNLAKDLKDIRKNDPEKAQQVLEEENKTIRYGEADAVHAEKRKEIQDTPKLTNEQKAKNALIMETWSFHDDNERFVESLKKGLENFDLEGLEKLAFVNIEAKTKTSGRAGFSGVDIAENIMTKDEANRVLMYAFSNLDDIRKTKPKIDLLLSKENVKFLRLPFIPEDAIKILNSEKGEQVDNKILQEVQDKEILNKVSHLLHEIHAHEEADGRITMTTPKEMPEMVRKAKEYFPALTDKTDQEIVKFLFEIRKNVPEVMKGQNIEGVFCDIEGTLFNGEELNTKTLDMLKEFEAQGKNITLWTDGDITKLQTLLDTAGIKYPLKSKIDHAGASAEIVIDNDDNNTFSAKTKIYAKKFIKI